MRLVLASEGVEGKEVIKLRRYNCRLGSVSKGLLLVSVLITL